jgi:hypothetical protein
MVSMIEPLINEIAGQKVEVYFKRPTIWANRSCKTKLGGIIPQLKEASINSKI